MSMREFIVFVLIGFGLHQTASITQKMPPGIEQLVGTTLGVESTLPLFDHMMKKQGVPSEYRGKAIMAYQLAFLQVGVGVAIGWLIDLLFGISRRPR